MKRLLNCSIIMATLVAGLAVATWPNAPVPSGSTSTTAAESMASAIEGPRSQPRSAGVESRAIVADTKVAESRPGGRRPASTAAPGASERADHDADPPRAAGNRLSFKAPIDFATGANPSSEAFNRAEGDQLSLIVTRSPLSDSVATGDFNHDGKPDVAQTNVIAGTVSVLLGDGRGGFATPQQHRVGVNPNFVVAGDLDLDGQLDLVVVNSGSQNLAILYGSAGGTFGDASIVAVPAPRNVAIGEFNGDGRPDLAVASSTLAEAATSPALSTAGGVTIFMGAGDKRIFGPAQFIPTTANHLPVNANFVAVGDFDDDGRDDLAVGAGISPNAGDRQAGDANLTGDDALIFLNRRGLFSTTPDQRIRVGGWPAAIAVADLDGDTDPDLALLDSASGDITTLSGNGQGRFVVKATNVTVGAIPRSLSVADFNDDGVPDLVTASFTASTVSVLQGHGDGTFQPAVDFWSGDAPTGAAVGDFDGDRRSDIVVGRLRTDHLALLLNDPQSRGDGVVVTRDIPFGNPPHPTFAAHQTLDVYSPAKKTTSFSGDGQRYPVVFFAHGGGAISGDKSMVSYLMRSLARKGIIAVSTNYRLGTGTNAGQTEDVVQAFRWTRDHVGSAAFGGDPGNIFVAGTSAGAALVIALATFPEYENEQRHIRGLVVAGGHNQVRGGGAATQPPSLLLNGDEGLERALAPISLAYVTDAKQRRAESHHLVVQGRDHVTIVSDLALDGDPGRVAVLNFMDAHL